MCTVYFEQVYPSVKCQFLSQFPDVEAESTCLSQAVCPSWPNEKWRFEYRWPPGSFPYSKARPHLIATSVIRKCPPLRNWLLRAHEAARHRFSERLEALGSTSSQEE
jgi:hypothetical protein